MVVNLTVCGVTPSCAAAASGSSSVKLPSARSTITPCSSRTRLASGGWRAYSAASFLSRETLTRAGTVVRPGMAAVSPLAGM